MSFLFPHGDWRQWRTMQWWRIWIDPLNKVARFCCFTVTFLPSSCAGSSAFSASRSPTFLSSTWCWCILLHLSWITLCSSTQLITSVQSVSSTYFWSLHLPTIFYFIMISSRFRVCAFQANSQYDLYFLTCLPRYIYRTQRLARPEHNSPCAAVCEQHSHPGA